MYGVGLGATGLNLGVRQHNLVLTSVLGLFREGGDFFFFFGGGGEGAGVNCPGGLIGFILMFPPNEFYKV